MTATSSGLVLPDNAIVDRGLVDRTGWASGPWDDEPDRVRWISPTGRPCLVNRPDGLGSLNGYVAVGRTHPLFEVDYSAVEGYENAPLADIEVHGGLTYSGVDPDGRGPYEGAWWFGFDCMHYRDLAPYRTKPEWRGVLVSPDEEEYRDFAYVRAEVEHLAEQLAAVTA